MKYETNASSFNQYLINYISLGFNSDMSRFLFHPFKYDSYNYQLYILSH